MSEYIVELTEENHIRLMAECDGIHEEVVRCRDCKHYHAEINGCDEFGDIWHDEYANVEPDGFCAWGKRRGDA